MQRRSSNDVLGNDHEGLQRYQSTCKSVQRPVRQTGHGTPYARPLLLGRTLIQTEHRASGRYVSHFSFTALETFGKYEV